MIAALLAVVALQDGSHAPDPGPRAGIVGLGGFRTVSRVDFGPSQNRLTAIYVFPDRARWHFENYAARERSEHQFVYRFGARVAEFAGAPSRELADEARDAAVLQMELRRAAMLWPDGFEWAELEASTRVTSVVLDTCCGGHPLGSLVATMAPEDARPRRIEARDATGGAVESIEVLTWQDHAGRAWPATLRVDGAGGAFTETIEAIDTRIHYLDASFRPPDRRAGAAGMRPGEPLPRDLVAMTYAAHDLAPGTGWEAAREHARRWIEEVGSALGGDAVDPVPMFELGPDGLPTRCLVRLAAPAFPAPAGFVTHHERLGVFLPLQEVREVAPASLQRLERAVPEDALPETPYVRLHERKNFPVELVLPYRPKE